MRRSHALTSCWRLFHSSFLSRRILRADSRFVILLQQGGCLVCCGAHILCATVFCRAEICGSIRR